MLGAIVGDIVGSVYEFRNHRSKEFELFKQQCFATDDSIMTLAIAKAVLESAPDHHDLADNAVKYMREVGQPYPYCGYGGRFMDWMYSDKPKPYNSFGNGAAMRVSPVAYAAKGLEEAVEMSKAVTAVTHNHPEGIKGAEATAVCTWLALHGAGKDRILDVVNSLYYHIDFTIDEIRSMGRDFQNNAPAVAFALRRRLQEAIDAYDKLRFTDTARADDLEDYAALLEYADKL